MQFLYSVPWRFYISDRHADTNERRQTVSWVNSGMGKHGHMKPTGNPETPSAVLPLEEIGEGFYEISAWAWTWRMGESGRQDLICLQNRNFGSTPSGGVRVIYGCNKLSLMEWLLKDKSLLPHSLCRSDIGHSFSGSSGSGLPSRLQAMWQPGLSFHLKAQERKDPFPSSAITGRSQSSRLLACGAWFFACCQMRALVPPQLLERGHPHFMLRASPHGNLFYQSLQAKETIESASKAEVTTWGASSWKGHSITLIL